MVDMLAENPADKQQSSYVPYEFSPMLSFTRAGFTHEGYLHCRRFFMETARSKRGFGTALRLNVNKAISLPSRSRRRGT